MFLKVVGSLILPNCPDYIHYRSVLYARAGIRTNDSTAAIVPEFIALTTSPMICTSYITYKLNVY